MLRTSSLVAACLIAARAVQAGAQILLAIKVPIEAFGIFVFAYSSCLLAGSLAPLGAQTMITRFLRRSLIGVESFPRAAYGSVLTGVLWQSGGFAVLCTLFLALARSDVLNDATAWLAAFGLTATIGLRRFLRRALLAAGAEVEAVGLDETVLPVVLLVLVVVLPDPSPARLLGPLAAASTLVAVWMYLRTRSLVADRLPSDAQPTAVRQAVETFRAASRHAGAALGARLIMQRVDTVVVPLFFSATSFGQLALATRLCFPLVLVPQVASAVLSARFSDASTRSAEGQLRSLFMRSSALALLGSLVLASGVLVLAAAMLWFGWLGDNKLDLTLLAIMLVGYLVASATGPAAPLLAMTGRERILARLSIVATAALLVLVPLTALTDNILWAAVVISVAQVAFSLAQLGVVLSALRGGASLPGAGLARGRP